MIGPKGQINNLDTNDVALSFMTLQMLDEKDLRHGCLENIKRRLEVSKANLKQHTAAIPVMMTFLSWQRPGAATNLTLDDNERRRVITHDGAELEHKTGIVGVTKIILSATHYSKLYSYVTIARPMLSVSDGRKGYF